MGITAYLFTDGKMWYIHCVVEAGRTIHIIPSLGKTRRETIKLFEELLESTFGYVPPYKLVRIKGVVRNPLEVITKYPPTE